LGWVLDGGAIALRSGVEEHSRLPVSCASSLKMICVAERLKVPLYAASENCSALYDGFASLSSNSAVAPMPIVGWRSSRTVVVCSVKRAGNRVEFTQVDRENLQAILRLWEGGSRFLLLSHSLHRFFVLLCFWVVAVWSLSVIDRDQVVARLVHKVHIAINISFCVVINSTNDRIRGATKRRSR
jgi:hypothetical protein